MFPSTTVPLPLNVGVVPAKPITPYQLLVGLPTSAVPFNVRPLVTVKVAALTLLPTSSTPLTVTPSKVPLPTTSEVLLVIVSFASRSVPPESVNRLPLWKVLETASTPPESTNAS